MDLNGLFNGQAFDMSVAPKVGGNYVEVPDGIYGLLILNHEIKRFDTGAKIVYEAMITSGAYKDTKLDIEFVTEHSNSEWIAREMDKLKAFFIACQQLNARSVGDAINSTPIVEIYHTEDKNGKTRNDGTPYKYRNFNFVKRDLSLYTLPQETQQQQQQQQPTANPAADAPAWMK
ncbi:DUF669 domain-containing protein [Photobacterium damselae]|uniref:DUF669 domain-containing protein n=1 Tax=Photobacterium damselae TaxID=38293 RepID=UPI001F1625D0|nr:DUF669 domain-containing protein [Photobacterium damselae]UKA12953.1 DUF669 domain-containing protein [Photobacterium damselae subsp. damselae]